jgi:GH24 family phage-related lysozyme (muramidase)
MRCSPDGVKLIADFEGFPNGGRPYNDPIGLATVGYGHLIARRRVTAADAKGVWVQGQGQPGVLTQQEGQQLLAQDLKPREERVAAMIKVSVSQSQFDALVSFAFNVGEGALAGSTLLRKLNAGDYQGAADGLLAWDKAGAPPRPLPGLTRRRQAERAMFLRTGASTSTSGATDGVQFTRLQGYTKSEIGWITEYDDLKRTGGDPQRREALQQAMTVQRKKIWRLAQPDGGDGKGWEFNNRRERYHTLLERTQAPKAAASP